MGNSAYNNEAFHSKTLVSVNKYSRNDHLRAYLRLQARRLLPPQLQIKYSSGEICSKALWVRISTSSLLFKCDVLLPTAAPRRGSVSQFGVYTELRATSFIIVIAGAGSGGVLMWRGAGVTEEPIKDERDLFF